MSCRTSYVHKNPKTGEISTKTTNTGITHTFKIIPGESLTRSRRKIRVKVRAESRCACITRHYQHCISHLTQIVDNGFDTFINLLLIRSINGEANMCVTMRIPSSFGQFVRMININAQLMDK